ncbi:hypothetical protein C8J56DRAFT_466430 [Mycena floridula]|nr:hypothetical protein C8J56DRAFT_466430 [Mycena floridula]
MAQGNAVLLKFSWSHSPSPDQPLGPALDEVLRVERRCSCISHLWSSLSRVRTVFCVALHIGRKTWSARICRSISNQAQAPIIIIHSQPWQTGPLATDSVFQPTASLTLVIWLNNVRRSLNLTNLCRQPSDIYCRRWTQKLTGAQASGFSASDCQLLSLGGGVNSTLPKLTRDSLDKCSPVSLCQSRLETRGRWQGNLNSQNNRPQLQLRRLRPRSNPLHGSNR